ncbi:hypothetical protein D3C72_1571880 [compost metagenome]
MKKMILLMVVTLSFVGTAKANDPQVATQITFSPIYSALVSTLFTGCGLACKVIVEGEEDLTYFVATQGEVRTARLEQTVLWARQNVNDLESASDLEVANALLSAIDVL